MPRSDWVISDWDNILPDLKHYVDWTDQARTERAVIASCGATVLYGDDLALGFDAITCPRCKELYLDEEIRNIARGHME
jgi:hypothetical protein